MFVREAGKREGVLDEGEIHLFGEVERGGCWNSGTGCGAVFLYSAVSLGVKGRGFQFGMVGSV
jgi:hypothetical protein